MAEAIHIPWYATVFRGDEFEAALEEIAPVAMQYGARSYAVYRSGDDRYKFLQVAEFSDRLDFARYWEGPEFVRWRARHVSWYQIPVLYSWHDVVAADRRGEAPAASWPQDAAAAAPPAGE